MIRTFQAMPPMSKAGLILFIVMAVWSMATIGGSAWDLKTHKPIHLLYRQIPECF